MATDLESENTSLGPQQFLSRHRDSFPDLVLTEHRPTPREVSRFDSVRSVVDLRSTRSGVGRTRVRRRCARKLSCSSRRVREGSERSVNARGFSDRSSVVVFLFLDTVRGRIGDLERDVLEVRARKELGFKFDVACKREGSLSQPAETAFEVKIHLTFDRFLPVRVEVLDLADFASRNPGLCELVGTFRDQWRDREQDVPEGTILRARLVVHDFDREYVSGRMDLDVDNPAN